MLFQLENPGEVRTRLDPIGDSFLFALKEGPWVTVLRICGTWSWLLNHMSVKLVVKKRTRRDPISSIFHAVSASTRHITSEGESWVPSRSMPCLRRLAILQPSLMHLGAELDQVQPPIRTVPSHHHRRIVASLRAHMADALHATEYSA